MLQGVGQPRQIPSGGLFVHKNEFIRQVARESGLPQTTVSQVLGAAVRVVARSLVVGQKVVWTGFGTFEVRNRQSRQGVNPQTKQAMMIDATQTPGFSASNSLKSAVRGQRGGNQGDGA